MGKQKSRLKEFVYGIKDYFLHFNKLKHPWGGPFNNQKLRCLIFESIISEINVNLIVETGTYTGATTNYFVSKVKCPIYSVELETRYFAFSKMRFLKNKRVKLFNSDSRSFLRYLFGKNDFKNKIIFFYLDAHWNEDLPLVEELKIIFNACNNVIIMIDDFKVPDDYGYDYDIYSGVDLDVDLLQPLAKYQLKCFFPINSKDETGGKRGAVILTNSIEFSRTLQEINLIKEFQLI